VPSPPDITLAKARSLQALLASKERYENACDRGLDYMLLRWIAAMTAVETYAIWERYAELRLLYSLSHSLSISFVRTRSSEFAPFREASRPSSSEEIGTSISVQPAISSH
jgi:hypothetical protein